MSLSSVSQTFRAIDVIRKKRDGIELSRGEIEGLVNAYTSGDIPDYQVSAWLMAVVLKGMTRPETAALTDAMLHSGDVLDLSSLAGEKGRQAFHGRSRRQDFSGAGSSRCRRRPCGSHDQRARSWATPAERSTSWKLSPAST